MVLRSFILVITLFLFSGCGSDGGGSTSASSSNVEAKIDSEFGYKFLEGDLITLDGSSSFGSIENYRFYYDGGTLCESSRSSCQTTELPIGENTVYLTVENRDSSDTDFITIQIDKYSSGSTTVSADLKASIEVLGGSTFEEGEYVVFDGGESNGDIVRYEFSYSGGSLCESDNTTCRTNQIPAGEHKIYLTVYSVDGKSNSAFDFITVQNQVTQPNTNVENKKPIANFVISTTEIEKGKELVLNSSSTDDKKVVSFQWSSSIDGSLGSGEQLKISTLSVGIHTITLIVKDEEGLLDSTTKQITVNNINVSTELKASIEVLGGSIFEEGEYIIFDAGESKGDIARYEFSYSGGSLCESDSATCKTDKIPAGEHKIYLTIYSINGESASDSNSISVEKLIKNMKPTANFIMSTTEIEKGKELVLNSSSTDDKKVVSFQWNSSIDGSLGNSEQLKISTLSVGIHTITLIVKDEEGLVDSTTKQVTIKEDIQQTLQSITYIWGNATTQDSDTEKVLVWGTGLSSDMTWEWQGE